MQLDTIVSVIEFELTGDNPVVELVYADREEQSPKTFHSHKFSLVLANHSEDVQETVSLIHSLARDLIDMVIVDERGTPDTIPSKKHKDVEDVGDDDD